MLKLSFPEKTISDLPIEQHQYIQWSSISLKDLNGTDPTLLLKYLSKLNSNLAISVVQNGLVDNAVLSSDEWTKELNKLPNQLVYAIFRKIQLPYSVLQEFIEDSDKVRYFGDCIAKYQYCIPAKKALQLLGREIGALFFNGDNPALLDYIFTPEGLAEIKELKISVNNKMYLTSTEAEKLGFRRKNRKISVAFLNRAGACDAGKRYCKNILKELGRTEITLDEAILEIRNSQSLRSRQALQQYMQWLHQYNEELPVAE